MQSGQIPWVNVASEYSSTYVSTRCQLPSSLRILLQDAQIGNKPRKDCTLGSTSTGSRSRNSSSSSSSMKLCRSVMPRAVFDTPIVFPVSSLIGEMVKETSIICPSFRRRTVLQCSIFSPPPPQPVNDYGLFVNGGGGVQKGYRL